MNIPNHTPVIPPPDDENNVTERHGESNDQTVEPGLKVIVDDKTVVTSRPPFQIRVARFVAWIHLILGVIYASSLVFRFGNSIAGDQGAPSFPFILIALVAFTFVYIVLHGIIGTWCEVINDILLGAVIEWPAALTIPRFFDRLREEAIIELVRTSFRQAGIPEIAAVIPHRPKIDSSGQSILYMATYLGCFFYAPLPIIVKAVFWKVELAFGILFLAYLFTIATLHNPQR